MYMNKLFYFLSCLALGTTLSLGLTSCDEDDPITETPETPEQPEQPEEPTTTSTTLATFSYYYSNKNISCAGDSVAFFALVDKMVKAKQDSVENAKGTLLIQHSTDNRRVLMVDLSDSQSASKTSNEIIRNLFESSSKGQGFVYTGGIHSEDYSVDITNDGKYSLGYVEKNFEFLICFPNIKNTVWTTSDADAEINKFSFKDNLAAGCVINDNADVAYEYSQKGYDMTMSLKGTEKCAFKFNNDGTELKLVRLDGADVADGPVYKQVAE